VFEELSLHILDIAMNSLRASARTVEIVIIEDAKRDWLILRIRDDGRGMDEGTQQAVLAKNGTTKRGRKRAIGLGLAMLRHTSEMCDGTFHLHSAPGKGTSVTASMRYSHVDRPPLGDLNGTVLALCAAAGPNVDVRLHYRSNGQDFRFSSQEGSPHERGRTQKAQGKSPETRAVA
jgi:anti-sigma regulatory factor (Ser/Thr protein kinase)